MAQITEQQRIQQIRKEVEAADKRPADRQFGFELIQVGGTEYRCAVISFPADDVLLNPTSHRLRSQLQSDPEWQELRRIHTRLKPSSYSSCISERLEHTINSTRSETHWTKKVKSIRG